MKNILKTEVNVNRYSFENTIYFAVILFSKKRRELVLNQSQKHLSNTKDRKLTNTLAQSENWCFHLKMPQWYKLIGKNMCFSTLMFYFQVLEDRFLWQRVLTTWAEWLGREIYRGHSYWTTWQLAGCTWQKSIHPHVPTLTTTINIEYCCKLITK